jgi:Ca2+-binding EF-hand superfamily protein
MILAGMLVAAAALGTGGAADAQQDSQQNVGSVPMGRMAILHFEAMDVNDDGAIDQEEFRAASAVIFDELDANENGVISREEFVSSPRGRMQLPLTTEGRPPGQEPTMAAGPTAVEPPGASVRAQRFEQIDVDGDGVISRDELEELHQVMFRAFDDDGDGLVSIEEFGRQMGRPWP